MNLTEKEQKKKKKKGIFPKCVWGEGELKDKDRLDLEMRRGGGRMPESGGLGR